MAWGKLADVTRRYLATGDPVYVEGRIRTRQWSDEGGQQRSRTEIIAQAIRLLGRKQLEPAAEPSAETES